MANALYPVWKGALLSASANTNLLTGNVRLTYADITSAYTYSVLHDFANDLGANDNPNYPSGPLLANKTVTSNSFNADDVAIAALSGATDLGAIILYVDSGAETTSRLVVYIDTGVTGLPFTPDGSDVTVVWSSSIFSL